MEEQNSIQTQNFYQKSSDIIRTQRLKNPDHHHSFLLVFLALYRYLKKTVFKNTSYSCK